MNTASNDETEAKTFLSQGQGDRFDRWVEFFSVIVLSLATVMTAWCGYQAAQWDGEQANYYNLATTAQVAASQKANEGMLRASTQVGLFVEYAAAISTENMELADFLFARFPTTLKAATDAWLALKPLQNPDAPLTPFDMDAYVLEEQIESEKLQAGLQRIVGARAMKARFSRLRCEPQACPACVTRYLGTRAVCVAGRCSVR